MLKESEIGLLSTKVPFAFSRRQEAAKTIADLNQGEIALDDLEREKLAKIVEVLAHPELEHLIDEGKITLGIIKPQAHQGRNLPKDDEAAADFLLEEIGRERIVFQISTQLSPDQAEEFYKLNRNNFQEILIDQNYTLWNQVVEFTSLGPLTFVLIYDESGDAVSWWRNKMGATHPSEADPDSIRGKYALDENLPNNLVHGSDSKESVKREVAVLKDVIQEIHKQSETAPQNLPLKEPGSKIRNSSS